MKSAEDSRDTVTADGRPVAVIAGAGPAGITAATELARGGAVRPVIFEASGAIGGISQTVNHRGNRIDIGGHRFFSKSRRVNEFWRGVMQMQTRPRCSRIFYLRRFFDYPVTLSWATLRNMGLWRTLRAGAGYLAATLRKRPERSLEDFYINRFGRPLYRMFFEDYTEKVWGVHPSRLGADWGAQRVKGLSIKEVLRHMLRPKKGKEAGERVETSLIEEFLYPPLGPGQLWETAARQAVEAGAELHMHTPVKEVNVRDNRLQSVTLEDGRVVPCRYLFSTMPVKELVASLRGVEVPTEVAKAAAALPYRDFITVGLLIDKSRLAANPRLATRINEVKDTWIYIQERDVRLGRIQIFNNWSPAMVAAPEGKLWIGLEYFCFENDEMWQMSDADFISLAINELVKINLLTSADEVEDAIRIRVKKAYPAYHGSYVQMPAIRRFLDSIDGLYCIGRNGQHRYNNMDHSMLTAMLAADHLHASLVASDTLPKNPLWEVNTEADYHEQK